MSNFRKYAAFYDLLYRDKDYAAEAEYVARTIRSIVPEARTILELGSGTGRHGRLLAELGFEVYGVERSSEMVEVARGAERPTGPGEAGSFACEVGDVCALSLGRTFDAVIALFHVISYQTTDRELQAAFQVAADHLRPGGIFLFDVWHGPAVVSEGPSVRVKEVADGIRRVKRTATPEIDTRAGTVKVVYEMRCETDGNGEIVEFREQHEMRYLFPAEIASLAEVAGLTTIRSEEFLTGGAPSNATWSAAYVLRK